MPWRPAALALAALRVRRALPLTLLSSACKCPFWATSESESGVSWRHLHMMVCLVSCLPLRPKPLLGAPVCLGRARLLRLSALEVLESGPANKNIQG